MTTSYAMSPDRIDAISEAVFADEALRERADEAEVGPFVAEVDDVIAGYADVRVEGDAGTLRWLHVDPERRGLGVGTALFERGVSELEDRDADVRAVTLASNTSAGTFFEKFEFERLDERKEEIAGLEAIEYVYAADAGGTESSESSESTSEETVHETPDGVTAPDGTDLSVGDETVDGSEGPFAQTYASDDRSEQYGYYCLNCGSTDVTMDSMDRIRCENCGNTRKPDEDYDGSYL